MGAFLKLITILWIVFSFSSAGHAQTPAEAVTKYLKSFEDITGGTLSFASLSPQSGSDLVFSDMTFSYDETIDVSRAKIDISLRFETDHFTFSGVKPTSDGFSYESSTISDDNTFSAEIKYKIADLSPEALTLEAVVSDYVVTGGYQKNHKKAAALKGETPVETLLLTFRDIAASSAFESMSYSYHLKYTIGNQQQVENTAEQVQLKDYHFGRIEYWKITNSTQKHTAYFPGSREGGARNLELIDHIESYEVFNNNTTEFIDALLGNLEDKEAAEPMSSKIKNYSLTSELFKMNIKESLSESTVKNDKNKSLNNMFQILSSALLLPEDEDIEEAIDDFFLDLSLVGIDLYSLFSFDHLQAKGITASFNNKDRTVGVDFAMDQINIEDSSSSGLGVFEFKDMSLHVLSPQTNGRKVELAKFERFAFEDIEFAKRSHLEAFFETLKNDRGQGFHNPFQLYSRTLAGLQAFVPDNLKIRFENAVVRSFEGVPIVTQWNYSLDLATDPDEGPFVVRVRLNGFLNLKELAKLEKDPDVVIFLELMEPLNVSELEVNYDVGFKWEADTQKAEFIIENTGFPALFTLDKEIQVSGLGKGFYLNEQNMRALLATLKLEKASVSLKDQGLISALKKSPHWSEYPPVGNEGARVDRWQVFVERAIRQLEADLAPANLPDLTKQVSNSLRAFLENDDGATFTISANPATPLLFFQIGLIAATAPEQVIDTLNLKVETVTH